jgi:hypothetical protein
LLTPLLGRCGGDNRSWVATRSTIPGAGFGPIAEVSLTGTFSVFLTPNAYE